VFPAAAVQQLDGVTGAMNTAVNIVGAGLLCDFQGSGAAQNR